MRPSHLDSKAKGTYRDDWGTPMMLLSAVRDIIGPIDVDLASSAEHNQIVMAREYYTRENPCPEFVEGGGTIWCNPPGPGKLVHWFWDTWIRSMQRRKDGAFLFFNVDHLRKARTPFYFDCTVVLLEKRQRFEGAPAGASFPSALILSDDRTKDSRVLDLGNAYLWRGNYPNQGI